MKVALELLLRAPGRRMRSELPSHNYSKLMLRHCSRLRKRQAARFPPICLSIKHTAFIFSIGASGISHIGLHVPVVSCLQKLHSDLAALSGQAMAFHSEHHNSLHARFHGIYHFLHARTQPPTSSAMAPPPSPLSSSLPLKQTSPPSPYSNPPSSTSRSRALQPVASLRRLFGGVGMLRVWMS
jgi:hypothetical protein